MTTADEARWHLGRDTAPAPVQRLRIGDLELTLDGIDVRRLAWRGVELVNRIYVGVRDTDWNTLPPAVSHRRVERSADRIVVTFEASHAGAGIEYAWRGRIELTPDGASYEMDGTAATAFRHNRIGFCVLHPASQAGCAYRATTPGEPVSGVLPERIEPQLIVDGLEQPMFPACSALAVDLGVGRLDMAFEGDLFEMEDQRNWTDASFKTYCTPIALGYPHAVEAGQAIRQAVRIRVGPASGAHAAPPASPPLRSLRRLPARGATPVELTPGPDGWPAMGVGLRPNEGGGGPSARVAALLAAARLDHLRLDVHLGEPEWRDGLSRGFHWADALGSGLEVALFGDASQLRELEAAGRLLRDPRVRRVLAMHEPTAGLAVAPAPWVDAVIAAVGAGQGTPPVLAATDGDFAELNRNRPALGPGSGVAYAANPQVHASDERSLLETLATHGETVRTARTFARGRIAVTPITLRGRFNPAAADPQASRLLPPPSDPRQPSLFAAGWLLGSIASLVAEGADSATWFEASGPRGIVGPSDPLGELRLVGPAQPYPAWFVLADLADRALGRPLIAESGAGPEITAVGIRFAADRVRVLLANPTPSRRVLTVGPVPSTAVRSRVLDARAAADAVRAPSRFRTAWDPATARRGAVRVDLPPFAYVCVEARGAR